MKTILKLIALPLLLQSLHVSAQVKTNLNNQSAISEHGLFAKSYKTQIDFAIPAKNITDLIETEKAEASNSIGTKPFQLAVPVAVDLDITKQTNWNYDSAFAYGKFTIKLNGALSASMNFDKFYLPPGTEMYVYNEDGRMITGPITENENNPNKIWGSWVYRGTFLIIEIKTPLLTIKDLVLHSNNIAYGYKEVYKTKVGGYGSSGPCEINVLCPLGNGWEPERNSVALVLNDNGSVWCSGSMIMNTCSTNRPFFLTANHCFTGQNVAAWRFTFQAWSAICTPSQNADGVTYNGSTLRANWSNSDFCLVELNNIPPVNSGMNYAGWTRSSTAALNATGIHHPAGDVMKISKADNAVVRTGYYGTGNTHWQVNWSAQNNGAGQVVTAVTEGGSSGSPLFDQNHRVVGQLHGGPSECSGSQLWDYYGSFDVSWTGGGTNATRLSNWLDPTGTNLMTTNTTPVSALTEHVGVLSISGNANLCSGSSQLLLTNNGIPYPGNVTWMSSNTSVATISSTGNPAILTKGGDGMIDITATINSCQTTVNTFKTISVGSPNMSNFNFKKDGPSCVTASYQPVSFGVSYTVGTNVFTGCSLKDLAGITEVEWQISSPYSYQVTNNAGIYNCLSGTVDKAGISVGFQMPPNNSYVVTIRYRVKNGCDWSFWSPGNNHIVQKCGFGFSISPNPVNSSLNVELGQKTVAGNKNMFIREIQITDKTGNVVKQLNYSAGNSKVMFDISDLKQDVYFIRVNNGKEWQSQQFSKQ